MKPSIRTLEELHKLAINSEEIIGFVKILINETEDTIIHALQSHKTEVTIPIYFGQYNLTSYNKLDAVKILTFNLIQVLKEKKYSVKLQRVTRGFNVIIDLSNVSGSVVSNMLDTYLNQYI